MLAAPPLAALVRRMASNSESISDGELIERFTRSADQAAFETISLVLRRRFSGELVQADGAPKASLREEGVYSVNKRNELIWTFSMKAGEEKKLKYSYTVLVPY